MTEIKLRAKYRSVVNGRFKSSHNDSGNTKRNKIGVDKHVARFGPIRHRVMVMGPTGKCRMVDA